MKIRNIVPSYVIAPTPGALVHFAAGVHEVELIACFFLGVGHGFGVGIAQAECEYSRRQSQQA